VRIVKRESLVGRTKRLVAGSDKYLLKKPRKRRGKGCGSSPCIERRAETHQEKGKSNILLFLVKESEKRGVWGNKPCLRIRGG